MAMRNEVQTCDNFFSKQDHQTILDYCLDCDYSYGETDNNTHRPTGMVHNIAEQSEIYQLIQTKIEQSIPAISQMKLYRMYVNCFAPSENPYFHTDGETGITLLYYPQTDWNLDDGGETQFYIENNIYGITPVCNRMVMFDAAVKHRATTFRDRHRFTVAIKYDE